MTAGVKVLLANEEVGVLLASKGSTVLLASDNVETPGATHETAGDQTGWEVSWPHMP
jgi:hypothetical protein